MGKKKKKKIKIPPTDYEVYTYGPIRLERMGRQVRLSSHWEPAQFEEYVERVKSERPNHKAAIDKKIAEVLALISQFEPLELLATVSLKNCFVNPEEYKEATHKGNECYFEYAQSLALSQRRKEGMPHATKESIDKFNSLLDEIFKAVLWFFASEFAERKRYSAELELRFASLSRYLFVRGDSFPEHHEDMIICIFCSHDIFLEKHYGFSCGQILSCVQEIGAQVLKNLKQEKETVRLAYELHGLFKEFVEKEGVNKFSSIDDCRNKYLALPEVVEKKKMFDKMIQSRSNNSFQIVPTKDIPEPLLKLLSCRFGDNSSFLTFEKYPAWPTNDSIIYANPLIEENGKFYCFSHTLLFRNIGNILEKWIQDKDNNYYQNAYQKKRAEYLENKALEYLRNIIPAAQVFGNLFYYIEEDGLKKHVETDGLILYDENLFIIETKAGGLSISARRGGIERMKGDVSELIDNAYQQALRTYRYIMDTPEAIFEYENGLEAVVLTDKGKYKNVYFLNITLHNLAHLSTHLNSLKSFNFIVGKEWPWSVFINNLRVISELIEFPSEFLCFLQRRIRANDYPQFYAVDELDFLMFFFYEGLYLEDDALKNVGRFTPHAYTEDLDRYYDYVAGRVSSGKKPRLRISEKYKNLITEIESTGKYRFTRVTTTLLSFDSETQQSIIDGLRKAQEASEKDGRAHDLTMYFSKSKMGLMFSVSANRRHDSWDKLDSHCKLKMYQTHFEEWILVTVDIGEKGKRHLDFSIYSQAWKYDADMESQLNRFKAWKMAQFRKTGQTLGRNDSCPCGSGTKYKKCCGK